MLAPHLLLSTSFSAGQLSPAHPSQEAEQARGLMTSPINTISGLHTALNPSHPSSAPTVLEACSGM